MYSVRAYASVRGLLLTGFAHVSGGLKNIITDENTQAEWREMALHRVFALSNLWPHFHVVCGFVGE